jgi:hypothetical protein
MGAEIWDYFVPYQEDIQAALDDLRLREFNAGRYRRKEGYDPQSPEEALSLAGDVGTRSILDMLYVSDRPDYHTVSPLPSDLLMELYGTEKPTHELVDANPEVYEHLAGERGQGAYIIVYGQDDKPKEIYFVGLSFD